MYEQVMDAGKGTKTERLKQLVKAEDWKQALQIAHTFRRVEKEDRTALVRAHEVLNFPGFYSQLGMDPQQLLLHGVNTLKKLWG
ncbi:MAG: hypothetical protein HQM11_07855 [SAR324 cluster bacterium]|nr:hypothetical protein [SAR324 cluster bacterium]